MRIAPPFAAVQALAARGLSAAIVFAPAAVLGAAADRYRAPALAAGAAVLALGGLLVARHRAAWRPPASGPVVLLYVAALGGVWAATRQAPDGFAHACRGGLLVAAVGLLVAHDLLRSGLEPRRRAARYCRRLVARARWPHQIGGFADLPEVRALREAVADDPGPALALLADPRPEVRAAAFVALWGRPGWRPAEAGAAVAALARSPEPGVRAVGLVALAGAADPVTVDAVAGYLRDPAPEVRQAAGEALLAGGGARWPAAREPVRRALADPLLAADGALPGSAGRLPPLAICDLTAWATELDPLAGRAVKTLVGHYAAVLRAGPRPDLAAELGRQVTDPHTPPVLRVELAGLLRGLGLIPPVLLDRMTDLDQPGPIRLFAAETLLTANPQDPDAVDVLRGLGRQSNRETALAIAKLLQTYLGMDFGLPPGPVAANTRAAAEAAKLVFQWATGRPAPPPAAESGSAWVTRPTSSAPLPALKPTAPPPRSQAVRPPGRGTGGPLW